MKKIILTLGAILFISFQLMAQTTITGTVTDSDGNPIPGATVRAKGVSGVGTVTGGDGSYSLQVPDGVSTLVFTFVGMQTQEVAISGTTVNATLKAEDVGLDEVVVTALGVSRERKALGYAVENVSADELNQTRQTNMMSALSGKVSGVQISGGTGNMGGSTRVLIRGANSITGNNSPLFVIDGTPIDNSNFNSVDAARGAGGVDWGNTAQDINPEDIESISVLKGPQAAALYGSRAANGVVMITTKKGESRQGIGVSVSTGVAFEQVNVLPNLQRLYGGGDSFDILGYEDGSGHYNVGVDVDGDGVDDYSSFDLIMNYGLDESHGPAYATTASEYQAALEEMGYSFSGSLPNEAIHYRPWNSFDEWDTEYYGQSIPWEAPANDVEDFFETGVAYNTTVALSGGDENTTYRMSYTNYTSEGYMPNSELDRNTFSVRASSKFGEALTGDASINYVKAEALGRPVTGYDDNNLMQKFVQWGQRQLDMDRLAAYENPDGTQRTWNRLAWNNPRPHYSDNPYWTRYKNFSYDLRDRYYGNIGLTYEMNDFFKIVGKTHADFYSWRMTDRVAIGSQAESSYSEDVRNMREMNYEILAIFDKSFGDVSVNANFGGNAMRSEYERNGAATSGGLVLPGLYTLDNSVNTALPEDYTEQKRINSLYGRLSFGWNNMVYLDVTGRNDWSSTLPEENNSYFYPSVTGSFVFSEAMDAAWLSFGKIRAGWAQVGNDTDPYRTQQAYTNYSPNFGNVPRYSLPNTMANAELKPEQTDSWEIGAEISLFNNRLSFDATYYDMETTDLITSIAVSASTGYLFKNINAGTMTNKGIELSVNGVILDMNGLVWDAGINFAQNENELTELKEGIDNYRMANGPFNVTVNAFVGKAYGVLMGTDYIYDADGNIVVEGEDAGFWAGTPKSTGEAVPLGSVLPDYNMGLSTGISYKGLRFSGLVDIQKGGHYFSTSYMWGWYSGMLEETAANNIREEGYLYEGSVTGDVVYDEEGNYTVENVQENTTLANFDAKRYSHYFGPDAQNVFKADYIKLRELRLSYTFSSALTGPIQSLTLSAWGRNLAVWGLDSEHFDPESAVTTSGNVQGIEGAALPSLRTFGFDLSFNF